MSTYISQSLRDQVRQRAKQRCEYCQSAEWLTGLRHELDHILPRYLGGPTTAENLCLACSNCNSHKHAHIQAADPESGEVVVARSLWSSTGHHPPD
jgi:5-methylcytosine-specific restriction endonuclease McrA